MSDSSNVRSAAKQLYSFIEAYTSIRSKIKTVFSEGGPSEDLDALRKRNLPGVFITSGGSDVILSVERPNLPICPPVPDALDGWLMADWKDHKVAVPSKRETRKEAYSTSELMALPEAERFDESGKLVQKTVYFEDDPARVKAWPEWVKLREAWRAQYQSLYAAHVIYTRLYDWKTTLDKEGFLKGCFLCNGFIRTEDGSVDYPLLMQQVFLEIDTEPSQPVLTVRLSDSAGTRISSDVIRQLSEDYNFEALGTLHKSIEEAGIDLLDAEEVRDYLRNFASSLSAECVWQDALDPEVFGETTKVVLFHKPMLYLTGLPSGVKEAIGKIMAEIDNGAEVPRPLRHLLCGYDKGEQIAAPPESDNPTPAERIALA